MRKPTAQCCIGLLVALLMGCCGQAVRAETVYKCVKDGKVSYTSNPGVGKGQCQEQVIRNDGPNPEDLARLLEQKRLRQEEEKKANEAALKEREIRAKELEAAATARRAQAIEEELLQLRQNPPTPPPVVGYPFYYPYWGAVPVPPHLPHDHRPHDHGIEASRQLNQPYSPPPINPSGGPLRAR